MIFEGLIDKKINAQELLNLISLIFDIPGQQIFITKDIYSLNIKPEDNIEIVCEKTNRKGDFIQKISIYLRSKNIQEKNIPEEKVFVDICKSINAKCLLSDDSYDPYTMILLEQGQRKNISLNPEDLDNDIYTVQK